jgi:ElaB/YqjD/DUF883 family membrane-anchored ribosome-binding protein
MNESQHNEPEALRSDIDVTRRRMDDTMDALGDRLQPRHLLDELLGFLRGGGNDGESRLTQIREKVTTSCDTAMHSVVDSVKQNPMPALVIGAGVAWMVYSSRKRSDYDYDEYYSSQDASMRYDPDTHYDRPLDYPAPVGSEWNEQGESKAWGQEGASKLGQIKDKASAATGQMKEKLSHATEAAREKLSHAGEAAREKMTAIRERAGEVTSRMRDTTADVYSRSRQRVVATADHHPLEVGLVALAAGLMVGLAMRTPRAVNRKLGPAADRLRERTREAGSEMLQKGKRVAEAAASAVKEEAEAQGLTPERLRDSAANIAERAREAGKQTAEREGLTPGTSGSTGKMGATGSGTTNPSGSDPSVARPAV